ncbi:RNA splicing factor [Lithospermum erythrorhizon]|uniref:RNA splicing factor n=1 Tax=Lithospermum erythrorhizon TaxID=34254 RepID=A0AAV3RD78_LITER
MDFDEYEYLEKTVENPEGKTVKDKANGDTHNSQEKERKRSSKHRSGDHYDEMDQLPKRSKSGDDSRDRERSSRRHSSSKDKERSERDAHKSSREHRDREEKERGRDKDREERSRKDGDREERSRKDGDREERSRKDGDRDRDRDKKRERDTVRKERGSEVERDGDREKDRSRRSSSRVERPLEEQEGERSREREKSRDRELLEREKEREFRTREREGNRFIIEGTKPVVYSLPEVRYHNSVFGRFTFKIIFYFLPQGCMALASGPIELRKFPYSSVEPEADPERDQRTVFVYQISLKADERDVYEFFSRVGKVRDVRLIMDRITKRSKGVGYVEFYDVMSVPMAIALSGQPLLGTPVMVKPSEAEKNLVQSTASMTTGVGGVNAVGARKLYVGNLHLSIREDQLRQVFEAFGTVELVQLPTDPQTGQCKGFAFVQFARLEDAKAAQNLNGQLEIAGRVIKVSAVTDQSGGQEIGVNASDIDDDDGGGLSLNASSRALLMQKLDRTGTASSFAGSFSSTPATGPATPLPVGPVFGSSPAVTSLVPPFGQVPSPAVPGLPSSGLTLPSLDTVGVPSECLLLKNMFDSKLETEPDFDLDIKEDVQDECSKFGTLKHIYVDKNSEGLVYLRFEITPAAISAQRALHGRWFAGKMITATYMAPQTYEAKFPGSG